VSVTVRCGLELEVTDRISLGFQVTENSYGIKPISMEYWDTPQENTSESYAVRSRNGISEFGLYRRGSAYKRRFENILERNFNLYFADRRPRGLRPI